MSKRRQIEVYDTPSGMGGTFTVEIVAHLDHERVKVRVWYGRATSQGWECWNEWDGYRFETKQAELRNRRMMPLYR